MPTHHDIKIWPEYFRAKLSGLKPWEHRCTVDRSFSVGDSVIFREWDPATEDYTDRTFGPVPIIYVMPLPLGHCIFTHGPEVSAPGRESAYSEALEQIERLANGALCFSALGDARTYVAEIQALAAKR